MTTVTTFRLQLNTEVKNLLNAMRDRGLTVVLAGGAARDLVQGMTDVHDLDFAVAGAKSPEHLRSMLEELTGVEVGRSGQAQGAFMVNFAGEKLDFTMARNESQVLSRHGVPEFDATLEDDARRRDFTINAMFAVMTEQDNVWRVVDFFGGLDDLRNRVLRMVCPENFETDHIRLMRAVRFCARDGFVMDEELRTRVRNAVLNRMSDKLLFDARLPREKFTEELMKSLAQTERPSRVFETMLDVGMVGTFMPELMPMVWCEQDPVWHPEGTVWVHTMHTVDAMAKWCDENGVKGLERAERVMWMLTHDVGKPMFGNTHDKMGVSMVQALGDRLFRQATESGNARVTRDMMAVCAFHMRHINFANNAGRTALRRFAEAVSEFDSSVTLEDLFAVNVADASGRPFTGELVTPESVVRMRELLATETVDTSNLVGMVTGKMLKTLGFKGSPLFGQVIREGFFAEGDAFVDEGGAREWARSRMNELMS